MRILNPSELNFVSGGGEQSFLTQEVIAITVPFGAFVGTLVGVCFSQIPTVKFFLRHNSCCEEVFPMAILGTIVGATTGAFCAIVQPLFN